MPAQDEIDALYAADPGEFVSARDTLAKRLRGEGEKEAAAEVKALRRPSAAAAAVNRAVRTDPDALEELLAAGDSLREAHAALGRGDRDAMRAARDRERRAVTALLRVAGVTEPLATKVRETLHAVALDDSVRAAVAAGRLEKEAAPGGFGVFGAGEPAADEGERRASKGSAAGGGAGRRASKASSGAGGGAERRASKGSAAGGGAAAGVGGGAAADEARAERLEAARRAREEARAVLAATQTDLERAERDAHAAADRIDRGRTAVEDAEARLAKAREQLEAAESAGETARRTLRDAKQASARAQAEAVEAEKRAKAAERRRK